MVSKVTDVQHGWIKRVLGIDVAEAGGGEAGITATTPTGEASGQVEAGRKSGSPLAPAVAFTKARLIWDQTRKHVQAELQKLERSVLSECADEPDFDVISANSKILYTILNYLDERLIDKLDEALNAEPGPERIARQNEAREIIDEYKDYIRTDDLLSDIDDNGFVDIDILPTLTTQLDDMARQLRAAT
jgi:hypothetical protein